MRHLRLLLLAAVTICSVHASATATGDAEWTLNATAVSKYLFRGVRLAGPCFQPSLDYTSGNLSLGVWTSAAFRDRVGGDSDPEVDLYGAYSLSVASEKLTLVPGFYLYNYPDADKSAGLYTTTFEPSLAAVFSAGDIQFTPKVYYDLMLKSTTWELTAAMAWPLTKLGTELDFIATVGTFLSKDVTVDAIPREKNWGDYWLVGVSVPVQVTMNSKVVLGFTYSVGRNNFYKQDGLPKLRNGEAGRHGAVTLSYAVTF